MKQEQSRSVGVSEERRPSERALGTRVRLSGDLVSDVFDAAEKQNTDPADFVRGAVHKALGDTEGNGRISVEGMSHDSANGNVTMGRPASRAVQQVADQRGTDPDTLIREAVSGAVESVREADRRSQRPARATRWLPAFDPLGIAEAMTNGAVRDPVLTALRQSLSNAGVRGRRGGGRGGQ